MFEHEKPDGKLSLQIVAMPKDTNANGDVFGGWLVSQMDMAAGIEARYITHGRAVTVAIDSMVFLKPVYIGDTVSCFAKMLRVGRTSVQFKIEVWTLSYNDQFYKKVAEGLFSFVSIDEQGKPKPHNLTIKP